MYEEEIRGAARKESVLGPRGTSEEQLFKQGVLVHRQFGRSHFKEILEGWSLERCLCHPQHAPVVS